MPFINKRYALNINNEIVSFRSANNLKEYKTADINQMYANTCQYM